MCVNECVCAWVRACVRACMLACVDACVCVRARACVCEFTCILRIGMPIIMIVCSVDYSKSNTLFRTFKRLHSVPSKGGLIYQLF